MRVSSQEELEQCARETRKIEETYLQYPSRLGHSRISQKGMTPIVLDADMIDTASVSLI